MQNLLEAKLIERFPTFFRDMYGSSIKTCLCYGIECGDGWYDLLFKLCENIESAEPPENFKIEQIKEKFGGLRFYYSNGNAEISDIVNSAENESYKICEVCSATKDVLTEGKWLKSLCVDCRNKRKTPNE